MCLIDGDKRDSVLDATKASIGVNLFCVKRSWIACIEFSLSEIPAWENITVCFVYKDTKANRERRRVAKPPDGEKREFNGSKRVLIVWFLIVENWKKLSIKPSWLRIERFLVTTLNLNSTVFLRLRLQKKNTFIQHF